MKKLKLGIVGLDSSHVIAFTQLLNDPANPHHVAGGEVIMACPGQPSADFPMSCDRLAGFTNELIATFQLPMVESPEEVARSCDAVFLEAVDARLHAELFARIAPFGKPVFVDKPFALGFAEAKHMIELSKRFKVPVMSCSALRYAEALTTQLNDIHEGEITGADFFAPLPLEPTQPGLFWYGIHPADMLYRTLGKGCRYVSAVMSGDHEIVTGVWADGRIGTIRGNRRGNPQFGGVIHRTSGSAYVDVAADTKPFYASLVEKITEMFRAGVSPIENEELLEIVRFLEAANESRLTGERVYL